MGTAIGKATSSNPTASTNTPSINLAKKLGFSRHVEETVFAWPSKF